MSQHPTGEIALSDLSKSFQLKGRPLNVLSNINLTVRAGESLAIVGASGSGKTTLLRLLAGLEAPDAGRVLVDGRPVAGVSRERAVIFQEPRLLPWRTVRENIAFGLEARGLPRAEIEAQTTEAVQVVGLAEFAEALPRQLSGGMAQRVGIARALAVRPEILLLDEPFGALDALTKLTLQEELVRIQHKTGLTLILVTHDLEEAVFLADRVLVLPSQKGGAIREVAIPLPHPRSRTAPAFTALRQRLMAAFGLH